MTVSVPDLVCVKVGVSDGDKPIEIEDVGDEVREAEMVEVLVFDRVPDFEGVFDREEVIEGVVVTVPDGLTCNLRGAKLFPLSLPSLPLPPASLPLPPPPLSLLLPTTKVLNIE